MARERKINSMVQREELSARLYDFFMRRNILHKRLHHIAKSAGVFESTLMKAIDGRGITLESQDRINECLDRELAIAESVVKAISVPINLLSITKKFD